MHPKHPVQIAREQKGWTRRELAERADVNRTTVGYIENNSSRFKTQETVADRIAAALGKRRDELFSPYEVSPLGKPAGPNSSGTYTRTSIVRELTTITTETVSIVSSQVVCPHCRLEVPSRPHCIQCGEKL